MSEQYWRIQVYFRPPEEKIYRAIEALAKNRGETTSKVVVGALKQWLDGQNVLGEVFEATPRVEVMATTEFSGPCRHRAFRQDGKVDCKLHGEGRDVTGCVGCADYEPR